MNTAPATAAGRPVELGSARTALYAFSVFLSAVLLFSIEPMIARMLLPIYGGSPAVWNTCMVFFQIVLVAGYAWAHGSMHAFGLPRQRLWQAALLLLSLLVLPRPLASIAAGAPPVVSILIQLTLGVGAACFVLSTNSSVTQRWFAHGTDDAPRDPFWLYAASNAGSLAALLAYPILVEPAFGLSTQLRLWHAGYVAFVAISLLTLMLAHPSGVVGAAAEHAPAVRVTWGRRATWMLRAAVAASLLLSVTMQIATDVVSAPLLWIVPLAIYLLTFVIAFSPSRRPPRRVLARCTTYGIALCLILVVVPTLFPLWFTLTVLLGTLFTGALLCHGDLADDRPDASALTDFYLWIAIGGAAGGLLNSVVAPLVFRSVAEYPLTLIALACLTPSTRWWLTARRALSRRTLRSVPGLAMTGAIVLAAVMIIVSRRGGSTPAGDTGLRWQFMPLPVLAFGVLFDSTVGVFALSATLVGAWVLAGLNFIDPIIDQQRSFFGLSRVTDNSYERLLIHGVTVHGDQRKTPALRDIPTAYYFPAGPLGAAMLQARPGAEIGIVGLGAGCLAPLARAGQHVTYYEIDPVVEAIARRDFTYLADAKAKIDLATGDGRQLLGNVPNGRLDLLLIDAFNSDAIPTHLLTDEALQLYLSKLAPDGVLVMHISNRYADLTSVFRGWQRATGHPVAIDDYVPSAADEAAGVRPTVAVAITRSSAALARLAATKQWYWLDNNGPAVHWTDDHVNLMAVLDRNVLQP
jgi:SAM-dependent methyltransferase